MRWIYVAVIVLFALATFVFALQNLEVVTMSLPRFQVRAPLALVTIVVYLLGALTGGSLLALLRRSYKGAQWSGEAAVTRVICPTGGRCKMLSSLARQIISVSRNSDLPYSSCIPPRLKGRTRRHGREAGCGGRRMRLLT